MPVELGYFLSVILISRLVFTFKDDPICKKDWLVMSAIQITGLLVFGFRVGMLVFAIVLILINYFFYRLEKNKKQINLKRLCSFYFLFLISTVFFSPWVGLSMDASVIRFINELPFYSVLFSLITFIPPEKVWISLAGGLFVTNEVNILIRYLFERYQLIPKFNPPQEKNLVKAFDRREYNAGRVIGILERLFVYYFVLIGQFAAIGLILTAKSFARFKDLDQREFAEYVLIGTLLSALMAMIIGIIVKTLL